MVVLQYTIIGSNRNIKHFLPARINSGIKDIEWLHGQKLVSPWSSAATSVEGEAGSWISAAAPATANMWGGGSQG